MMRDLAWDADLHRGDWTKTIDSEWAATYRDLYAALHAITPQYYRSFQNLPEEIYPLGKAQVGLV
jgi:hypothetical protein